jgi:electron transfer flavoprotein alpha subunit
MKALLVGEFREGKLLGSTYELVAFAQKLGAEASLFLIGSEDQVPRFDGRVYLGDAGPSGEYNPDVHKQMLLDVIATENPDAVVFSHSSYGWDLAPRMAIALQAAQISEVVDIAEDGFIVPVCNAKLRRTLQAKTKITVLTLQPGAFSLDGEPSGTPEVRKVAAGGPGGVEFLGYEIAEKGGVDLTKAEIIVSAGRGIGKPENLELVAALARALGGEYAASRPVVDAGWAEHNRQVGSTGQTVSPKLYIACGISGAIQHLAGMKKSDFVVAINTDKDAPIGEVADVLLVADLKQLLPVLTEKAGGF